MLSIKRISVSILLILGILLSACAQATPQPSEPSVVKETVVVRETVVVTEKEQVEKLITPTNVPGRQTIIVARYA
jgi:hypothetical protein